MCRSRHCGLLAATVFAWVTVGLLVYSPGAAHPADVKEPPAPEKKPEDMAPIFNPRVRLPVDRTAHMQVAEVSRLIEASEFKDAAVLLQGLIDDKGDRFLLDANNQCFNIRGEAYKLLRGMPKQGLEYYDLLYAKTARDLLERAKRDANPALFAEVAQRFLFTPAGAEALELLGAYFLDRGQFTMAALCFERFLSRGVKEENLSPVALYRMALAFGRAGDEEKCHRLWKLYQDRLKADPRLAGQLGGWKVDELHAFLRQGSVADLGPAQTEWMQYGGSAARTAAAGEEIPLLEAVFTHPMGNQVVADWIKRGVVNRQPAVRPALPGYHPLAFGGKAYARTHEKLIVIDLKERDLAWDTTPLQLGLHKCVDPTSPVEIAGGEMGRWLQEYNRNGASIFYDNTLLGTMSADSDRLYVIEDLAVPPHPIFTQSGRGFGVVRSPAVAKCSAYNRLRAYDHKTGRAVWELGTTENESDPFNDTAFLGPPLPLGGRLYVLVEQRGELRLVCLHPEVDRSGPRSVHELHVVWSKPLGLVDPPVWEDPLRRTQAAHLAYADGVLICPTNAGTVLAIDMMTQAPLWAHMYEEAAARPAANPPRQPRPLPRMTPAWHGSTPMIAAGKVIIAPPDVDVIHCVDIRSGTLDWKLPRTEADCYVAGIWRDLVLLVGRNDCRALELATGKEKWTVETGTPSGRGVFSGDNYLLPAQPADVVVIDLALGKVKDRIKSPKGELPGNLLIHEGCIISQGLDDIFIFPAK